MIKKWLVLLLFMAFMPSGAMNTATIESVERISATRPVTQVITTYIPRSYDVVSDLQEESKCCFKTSRWFLQPFSVFAPLLSTALVTVGEFYLEKDPKIASVLNLADIISSACGFVTNVLLLKVNNKLRNIDEYILSTIKQEANSNVQDANV